MNKTYRSIIINAVNKTVTEYQFSDLDTAKEKLDWRLAASCYRFDDSNLMLVDDEGLLKGEPEHYFILDEFPQPIATNAIIVGMDDDGEDADSTLSLDRIIQQIMFLNANEVRLFMEGEQKMVDKMRNDPRYRHCVFSTMKEALGKE